MYFCINQMKYWYEVQGDGDPLVLLHGFTGSRNTWKPFIQSWKNNWTCITIDLPGHGKTTGSVSSMEACCVDLHALFNYLKLNKFHLLGYSMGGRTAITYAMLYPEMISSLLLESTSPGLKTAEERRQRKEKDNYLAVQIEEKGIDWFVNYWEKIPLFQSQQKLPNSQQQIIREERLSQHASGLADSLRTMGTGVQRSWWEELSSFSKPVLLIAGENDQKYCKLMKVMDKHFEYACLQIISEAGHAIHVEKPKIFGKIVNEYITGTKLA
ncbi:2-succinyl-6-hydroxy-2,4-cyclohexadiene-1-carboxylate synthase [Virgibacillus salexigens]|uniref:2-succinyl-6-hydroxy-2, 4-cyclohexadiene-1-carboxylate synthase n=1 Tax=Virgibacillus TaxID=84406 RepID=UPI0013704B8B|nr:MULTISPECIES: 2-succinyl-6-hydroxy-2,4-cyclohexadiene-1-carboxylate synthase [Virgibacillus]MYL40017.1 2-succinyl-6-hydroxy-2,4-cyclohexadiene-1-carboxylate synthase [Virgibacillus massiliensis]